MFCIKWDQTCTTRTVWTLQSFYTRSVFSIASVPTLTKGTSKPPPHKSYPYCELKTASPPFLPLPISSPCFGTSLHFPIFLRSQKLYQCILGLTISPHQIAPPLPPPNTLSLSGMIGVIGAGCVNHWEGTPSGIPGVTELS